MDPNICFTLFYTILRGREHISTHMNVLVNEICSMDPNIDFTVIYTVLRGREHIYTPTVMTEYHQAYSKLM